MPRSEQNQPLASRSHEVKQKHDDHNDKAPSSCQNNAKLFYGNKLFRCYEPLHNTIIQMEFKFKFLSLH